MTREEAIELLEDLDGAIEDNQGRDYDEAFRMAIEALANLKEEFESAVPNCQKCAIKELWEETEKEDLVAVVRCKDCRHRDLFSCPLADNDFQKDEDFCSWGERREPTE